MTTENLQPDLESIEKALTEEKQRMSRNLFHMATPQHGNKKRGVGITRKNKQTTKKAVKLAKSQRKTNQKISKKKFRPTGSKQRK